MLKSISAIVVAAAIAAAVTVLSAPAAKVDAGPIAKPAETAMTRLRRSAPGPICAASAPNSATRKSAWSPPSGSPTDPLTRTAAALGSPLETIEIP